jgi:hypothetical protein
MDGLEPRRLLATIAGVVFGDIDRDGVRDASEVGIAGRRVYIDANNNRAFDVGERATWSESDGAFSIPRNPAGSWRVRVVLPSATQLTTTVPVVTTTATNTVGNVRIGIAAMNSGSISGVVFSDEAANLVRESVDLPLADRTVFLDRNANNVLDAGEVFVKTDAAGRYTFASVTAGWHRVRQVVPTGTEQVSPVSNGSRAVNVGSGQNVTAIDFSTTPADIDDQLSESRPMTLDTPYNDAIDRPTDVDTFRFLVLPGERRVLTFETTASLTMRVIDAHCNVLFTGTRLDRTFDTRQTIWIVITGTTGALPDLLTGFNDRPGNMGTYRLTLTAGPVR